MEYKIIQEAAQNISDFQKKVQEYLDKGFKPKGSIKIKRPYIYQVLIRERS